jgi:hypothetical protein
MGFEKKSPRQNHSASTVRAYPLHCRVCIAMRKSAILKNRTDSAEKRPLSAVATTTVLSRANVVESTSASKKPFLGPAPESAAPVAEEPEKATEAPKTFSQPAPLRKPFVAQSTGGDMDAAQAGLVKKRKLLNISYKKGPTSTTTSTTTTSTASNKTAKSTPSSTTDTPVERYFMAMFTKRSNKKHKVYEDGVIAVCGGIVKLFDMEAKLLGKSNGYTAQNLSDLHAGNELFIGGKVGLFVVCCCCCCCFVGGVVVVCCLLLLLLLLLLNVVVVVVVVVVRCLLLLSICRLYFRNWKLVLP